MTPIQRNLPRDMVESWKTTVDAKTYLKSPEQGAATVVWAAIGKAWEGRGGKYLEDCGEGTLAGEQVDAASAEPGHAAHAYDLQLADSLWAKSMQLVGMG